MSNDTNHGVVDICLLMELLGVIICILSRSGEGPKVEDN